MLDCLQSSSLQLFKEQYHEAIRYIPNTYNSIICLETNKVFSF